MKLTVLIISIYGIIFKAVNGFIFDDKNETQKLNKNCDKGDREVSEGNIGQASEFPWLGLLRAHIHKRGQSLKIAVTGVVLVKTKFAIGNANDIVRVPREALRSDTKVMFLTSDGEPWYCEVVDSITHPEYEITTYNTVAILELHYTNSRIVPHPICWPFKNFNTSNQLYGIGYTDEFGNADCNWCTGVASFNSCFEQQNKILENQILEKTFHQLQYVDKTLCTEFYKRSNYSEGNLTEPMNYQCAFGLHSKKNCFWDTGMVVASNITGYWTMTGLVIGGPGCAAPARFLDILSYMPWIITTMDLDDDGLDYRKR